MFKRYSLHVGINDYPGSGNDLNGCVNDANNWSRFMSTMGYPDGDQIVLLDSDATQKNVTEAIQRAMTDLRWGDRFVFTYSGHGSWVPDLDGDEADSRDETLVLYDWDSLGLLTDDAMYRLFQQRRKGVRVYQFSDSCFSGTVARLLLVNTLGRIDSFTKPRFFNPAMLTPGLLDHDMPAFRNVTSRPGTALMSGCDDTQYSYDTHFDNAPQGAFSYYALKSAGELAMANQRVSMAAWHRKIRTYLPSTWYDQSPQLQASAWQKTWTL